MNVSIREPEEPAQACVIWMHGLGADASDMSGLVDQLPLTVPVRHVFVNAPIRPVTLNNNMPMRAWYDVIGMKLSDREDRDGILQSERLICEVIKSQCADGFQASHIFLAGFSQGSAMALRTGLQCNDRLGGVIALSGYLPLALDCDPKLDRQVPVWMAAGRFDPVVQLSWTKHSFDWLLSHGFERVTWHDYPMAHTICAQECHDLARWLSSIIIGLSSI